MGRGAIDRLDAVQDGFVMALTDGLPLNPSDPRITRYVKNRYDHLCKRERTRRCGCFPHDDDSDAVSISQQKPLEILAAEESSADLLDIIDSHLSDVQARIIRAVFWGGHSAPEAATLLNLNVNTVYTNLRRGLARLRTLLGSLNEPGGDRSPTRPAAPRRSILRCSLNELDASSARADSVARQRGPKPLRECA